MDRSLKMNSLRFLALLAALGVASAIVIFSPVSAHEGALKERLHAVERWIILLNNELAPPTVNQIGASAYDMAVIDDIATLSWNRSLDVRPMVSYLKAKPDGGRRLVISYLNIGQAEDYRTYFPEIWKTHPPSWLIGADPEGWEGNFPVAYWHPEWQEILLGPYGLVQQIAREGFDGVYLDWVAGYHDEAVQRRAAADGVDPRVEMIRLLMRLGAAARQINPDFLLIPQNVSDLVDVPEVLQVIDGLSQEAIWFDGTVDDDPPGDCPLPRTEAEAGTPAFIAALPSACRQAYYEGRAEILNYAQEEYIAPRYRAARDAGIVLFNIEYALEPGNVAEAARLSHGLGTRPFFAARSLADFLPPAY
jgi:uncharacterized protein (TIGR01370 family)